MARNLENIDHLVLEIGTIGLEFTLDTGKYCRRTRPDRAQLSAATRMDRHILAKSMPDKPDQQDSSLHSTMREFHATCVILTHRAMEASMRRWQQNRRMEMSVWTHTSAANSSRNV